ncbi:hypothetical protein [Saccharothrix variisporea]|uniref:hypothetical protein n=1 Tax=Saccharothrix variisporea TaxID=543527 RepID=UPI00319DB01B
MLPYLDSPDALLPEVPCEYMIEQVERQREVLERRISCLERNRDALDAYLAAARQSA